MNQKNKLHGITSFLAISASVVSACICVLLISGDYHSAHYKMDTYERELQGWEACRQTNPAYFKANEQAVNSCLTNINETRSNFWVKIPKAQWVGILILAGLTSASAGYIATWVVVWLAGFILYEVVRLLTFSDNHNTKRQRRKASCGVPKKHSPQPSAARA